MHHIDPHRLPAWQSVKAHDLLCCKTPHVVLPPTLVDVRPSPVKCQGECGDKVWEVLSGMRHMARWQALEDTSAVKRTSDRESAGFEAEWRQLTKLIEADRRLQVAPSAPAAPAH